MRRSARFSVAVALTVLVATGCGSTAHKPPALSHPGRFPVVVAHPKAQTSGLPNVKIGPNGAVLLSRSRLVFIAGGSVRCAWLPARLTVLGPSSIRIDMRVNGDVASCVTAAVGFPIAVKIDPQLVDVSRPLTVRVVYKARLGDRTRHWIRTAVAPALSRS
jgi:hypothetical protein